MHTRILSWAALVAAGLSLVLTFASDAPETVLNAAPVAVARPGSTPSAAPTDLGTIRREVARISAEVANVSAVQGAIEDQLANQPPPDVVPDSSQAEVDAMLAGTQMKLSALAAAEPVDTTWAGPAEVAVTERLSKLGTAVQSVSALECRSTMCRVEVRYDQDHVDPSQFAEQLNGLPPWPANTFFRVELGEDPRAFLVFAREGHALPAPS